MRKEWGRYLRWHGCLLLVVAAFATYALLTSRLMPGGFFHCVMHDLLHLYCPFCGGTRAFFALFQLDFLNALRLNAAVLLAALVFVLLDIRAFLRLCFRRKGPLFPRHLGRVAILYFALWTVALNTAMLYGFDMVGDLSAYWQGEIAPLRAALFLPLAAMTVLSFLLGTGILPVRTRQVRLGFAWLSGCLLISLLCVLYVQWLLLLLYIPLIVGVLCQLLFKRETA